MWKKIAIGAAIAAATLGAGTAALATSGSTTSGSPSPSAAAATSSASAAPSSASGPEHGRHLGRFLARHVLHAQWVTRDDKTNTFVTHNAIRGQVTAVSATSITVRAADNVSETYTVNSTTKVRLRAEKKGTTGSIGAVHTGDEVAVVGTGTSTLTATWIVDGKK